ncbi:MAG TPA: hypothetical protein DCM05_09110 [Elusimicrobia bacterium]|nr:MAG: hypothetical protein A2293_11370 [Elusimicrobia bacterium RIFOXYB2_FULL_49_7]HAH06668.1 hypothetical protein [Elusimicrobiota bacterium]
MNNELIRSLRYKLQKRTRRLNSTGLQLFHLGLKQYWGFLQGDSLLSSVLEELEKKKPEMAAEADKILQGQTPGFSTEMEIVAASYFVIKKCVAHTDQGIEGSVGHRYDRDSKDDASVESFRSIFLEPLYDYIDEQLDDQRAILAQLKRYKHRCEWFRRSRLAALWNADTQQGEKNLAYDLYEYLFEQGIEFSIEPRSASGIADLVGAQTGPERLVADAKVFTSDKGKHYLINAFNQIYSYTVDFNEPFGYLVVFKFCPEDIRFPFAAQEQSVPCMTHNNKTIFVLVIDLCEEQESASKRGPLRTIEISEEELIRVKQ